MSVFQSSWVYLRRPDSGIGQAELAEIKSMYGGVLIAVHDPITLSNGQHFEPYTVEAWSRIMGHASSRTTVDLYAHLDLSDARLDVLLLDTVSVL